MMFSRFKNKKKYHNSADSSGFFSYFSSPDAAKIFEENYYKALQLWSRIPQSHYITTDYGKTHCLSLSHDRCLTSDVSSMQELGFLQSQTPQDSLTFAPDVSGLAMNGLPARSSHDPALILLHGFGATSLMWQAIMPQLSTMFDCIACDIPGQLGLSDNSGQPLRYIWQYTRWLEQVIENLGWSNRPIIIIGYSYGGNIAARFAARHACRIHHLCLIEPAVVVNTIKLDFFCEFMSLTHKTLTQEEVDELLSEREQWDYYNPYTEKTMLVGLQFFKNRRFVVPLPVPLWKLWSLKDRIDIVLAGKSEILYAGRAKTLARILLPLAKVTIFPQATHSLPGKYGSQLVSLLERAARH